MGGYAPPPAEEYRPATAEEADAQNVVGRENRAKVGLGGGYGGRSSSELDYINYQTQQQEQQRQQEQEQQRRVASGQDPSYQSGQAARAGNIPEQQSERTYLEGLQNRPRYVDSSQVGDTRTQDYLRMTDTLRQMGMPVPEREQLTGKILEGQRKVAEGTPGTRDDQFFLNELSKWNTRGIEGSGAEHYYKKQSANPKDWTANTQENWGDVALAVEKGGREQKDFTVDKYGFNPNVRGALGYTKPMKYEGWEGDAAIDQQQVRQVGGVLPGGKGLQETAWEVAKTGKTANVDFQPAIDYVNYQKGRMGPYGNLYGGTPDTTPDMPPGGGTPGAAPIYDESSAKRPFVSANVPGKTPTGKDWNPFVASAAEPSGYISEGVQIPKTLIQGEQPPKDHKHYLISATTSKWVGGAVGSSVDFVTGIIGWTPFKDRMQTIDPKLEKFRTENEQMKLTSSPEEYNTFLQKKYEEGVLTKPITSPTFIENPRLIYDYGEFSKWGSGAGDIVRGKLGFTQAQLDASQYNIEQKKGIETIPEKLIFGTGYTVSTHPEKVISAYGGGAVMVAGGELIGAGAGATGITARLAATAAAHPTAAAISTNVVRFGVPTALGGATYYGASEGLTASPERTNVNLGKMYPELVGVTYGGGSAYLGARAVERYGLPGIGPFIAGQTGKKVFLPGWEEQTKVIDFTAKKGNVYGDRGITVDAKGNPIVSVMGKEPIGVPTVREIGEGMIYPRKSELNLRNPKQNIAIDLSPDDPSGGIYSRTDIRNLGEILNRPELSKGFTNLGTKTRTTGEYGVSPVDSSPIPMDMMPGTKFQSGRSGESLPAQTNLWADLLKLKVERIVPEPKGLGKITGASQTYVNPEIRASTRASVTVDSVDAIMQNQMRYSALKKAAKQQRVADIIPREIKSEPTNIGNIEDILKVIQESEKRPTTTTKPKRVLEVKPDTTSSADYNAAMWKVWTKERTPTILSWDAINIAKGAKPKTGINVWQEDIVKPDTIVNLGSGQLPRNTVDTIQTGNTGQVQKQIPDAIQVPFTATITRSVPGWPTIPEIIKPPKPVPETPFVPLYQPPDKPVPDRPWTPTNIPPTTKLPPWTTIPPFIPPLSPTFGGSVGQGTKRRPRKFTELFPIGLYDSTMAAMRGKRLPKGKAKKGRIIPAKRAKKK